MKTNLVYAAAHLKYNVKNKLMYVLGMCRIANPYSERHGKLIMHSTGAKKGTKAAP